MMFCIFSTFSLLSLLHTALKSPSGHYRSISQPPLTISPAPSLAPRVQAKDNLSPQGASCKARTGKDCGALLEVQPSTPTQFYRRRSFPERASDLPKVTQALAEFLPSRFSLCFLLCSLPTLQESSGVSRNFQQAFSLGLLPPAPKETRDTELDADSLPPCGCSPEYRLPQLALWKSCHRILTLTLTFLLAPGASGKIALLT